MNGLDSLGACALNKLHLLSLQNLHLSMIVLVGSLDLSQEILLMVCGRLGTLEEHLSALPRRVAGPGALVLLGEGVIFGLGLAHGGLDFADSLLGREAVGLPAFTVAFGNGGELHQVIVHDVERGGELEAVVCHSVVYHEHVVVGEGKGALLVFGSVEAVLGHATELLESLGVFFFEPGSLFEEKGKLLRRVEASGKTVSYGSQA